MKFIYIDDIDNRQTVHFNIRNDLKSCGIKLSKSKLRAKSESLVDTGLIFGNWLAFLQCCDVPNCGKVPSFLIDTLEEIEKNIVVEGLFRKSGSAARQKELRQIINDGGSVENAQPLDLASLLKQFFRELPDSLFPSPWDELFLRCCSLPGTADRLRSLLQLCLLLSDRHLAVVRYVMQFLWRVTLHSSQNKMDASNLAICLTPSFLHNCLKSFDDKSVTAAGGGEGRLKLAIDGIQMLIENAESIGMVDEELCAEDLDTLAKSCPLSDDECDRNDGEYSKLRRRKKRIQGLVTNLSSSFTRWRRNSRGHNASGLSNNSTFLSSSHPLGVDLSMTVTADDTVLNDSKVSRITRKRKSDETDASATMSNAKRKALLRNMAAHSSTPRRNSEFEGQEMTTFTDTNAGLIFTATPTRSQINQILDAKSAAKSSKKGTKTSPRGASNGNSVKKSVKKLLRRLSSGRETDVDKRDATPSSGSKKRQRTPSSPARLVTSLMQPDNSPPLIITVHHAIRHPPSAITSRQRNPALHRRSRSLPYMDNDNTPIYMRQTANSNAVVSGVLAASPILHQNSAAEVDLTAVINDELLVKRLSVGSVSSVEFDDDSISSGDRFLPKIEMAHDKAFLQESVCVADSDNVVTAATNIGKELSAQHSSDVAIVKKKVQPAIVYARTEEIRLETIEDLQSILSLDKLIEEVENTVDDTEKLKSKSTASVQEETAGKKCESKAKDFCVPNKPPTAGSPACFKPAEVLKNRMLLLEGRGGDGMHSPRGAPPGVLTRMPRESILNLRDSGRVATRIGEYNNRSKNDVGPRTSTRRSSMMRAVNASHNKTLSTGRTSTSTTTVPLKIPAAFQNGRKTGKDVTTTSTTVSKEPFCCPEAPKPSTRTSSGAARRVRHEGSAKTSAFLGSLAVSTRPEVSCGDVTVVSSETPLAALSPRSSGDTGSKRPVLKDTSFLSNAQPRRDKPLVFVKVPNNITTQLPVAKQQVALNSSTYSRATRSQATADSAVGKSSVVGNAEAGSTTGNVSPAAKRIKRLKDSPKSVYRPRHRPSVGSPAKVLGRTGSKHVPVARWDI